MEYCLFVGVEALCFVNIFLWCIGFNFKLSVPSRLRDAMIEKALSHSMRKCVNYLLGVYQKKKLTIVNLSRGTLKQVNDMRLPV